MSGVKSGCWALMVLASLLSGAPQALADEGEGDRASMERAIYGGRRATAADLHATVSLVNADASFSFCTGTLIAPRVVTTAAHCVVKENDRTGEVEGPVDPHTLQVVAGAVDAVASLSSQRRAVARVVVHPGYPNFFWPTHPSGAGRWDDIALLILKSDVTDMRFATIPTVEQAMGALTRGTSLVISGYGATGPDRDDGGVLYIAEIPFDERVDAEVVLGARGEADSCPGDSGGPAYLLDSDRLWLIGITSRAPEDVSEPCGNAGIYGFAPVYRDWFALNSEGHYAPGDVGSGNDAGDDDWGDWDDWDCSSGASGLSMWLLVLPFLLLMRRRLRQRGFMTGG